jgi:arabinogalactan oligomer/maltooligosaccharide transport system permease protein
MTLAVGLRSFISGRYASNWGVFAAGAMLAALPVVILFQVLQRFIVEGLSAGSVKG